MPRIDFKALKSSISMPDVLRHYGLLEDMQERAEKRQLVGPSPFRKGKSRTSLKVDLEKNCWYDFGLKKGGSVIDFVVVKEGVGLRAAAERLQSWFQDVAEAETTPEGDGTSLLDIFAEPPLDRAQVFFALSLAALGELEETERQQYILSFTKALVLKLSA